MSTSVRVKNLKYKEEVHHLLLSSFIYLETPDSNRGVENYCLKANMYAFSRLQELDYSICYV